MPTSEALRAHASAAICAANGVPLREPLKPTEPALDHATTIPCGSVIVTMVLLKVACTCATPSDTVLRVRRTRRGAGAAPAAPAAAGAAPPADAGAPPPCGRSARGALGAAAPSGASLVSFSSAMKSHYPFDGACFLPATTLRGPLRVRALVWVRWPRTGSPLR